MVFHEISKKIHEWLCKQPNVKEESLTDWLLFELSQKNKLIKYFAFTRNEESTIGADWDWWILTTIGAYRFRVQAKKLRVDKDNWSSINYSNKHGTQIDILRESAKRDYAFPLYMMYSSSLPNVCKQSNTYRSDIFQNLIKRCKDCPCGSFLSPARNVFNTVFGSKRRVINDETLLNISLKLSSFDYFFESKNSMKNLCENLELLHSNCANGLLPNYCDGFKFEYEESGYCNNQQTIPDWLNALIREKRQFKESLIPKFFEDEFKHKLPDVQGFVFIDLRDKL